MFTQKESAKVFSKIIVHPDTKCWNWIGSLSDGYGRIYIKKRRWKAHRLLFFWANGILPDWKNKESLEVDHLCNNRSCVNPNHLLLASAKENVLRGRGPTAINARKQTCIHGHTSLYKVGNRRRCRECRKTLDASEKRKQWKKQWLNKRTN